MKKGLGLGKGLDALISSANSIDEVNQHVMELRINEIEPNIQQPRKVFDQDKLQVLSDSIKEHGVVQPIIVKKENGRYVIVAGERRWRASKLAGLKTIPVIIKELTSREVMEIALIENLQREDLNPIEEAEAYQKLMEDHQMTQEEVAKVVGKSRAAVANSVRLLSLDEEIRAMVSDGRLTSGHARALITIADMRKQKELANDIIEKGLNVRETEKLSSQKEKLNTNKKPAVKKETIAMSDLSENLKSIFGTKVDIQKGKDKGKIIIEYYSNDEFDRIIEILTHKS